MFDLLLLWTLRFTRKTQQILVYVQGTLGAVLLGHQIQPGSEWSGSPVEGFSTGLHFGKE